MCPANRWCGGNSDVIIMAEKVEEEAVCYKCQCGVFFAIRENALKHKCSLTGRSAPLEHHFDASNDKTMFQCETCKNFFDNMDVFKQHECCQSSSSSSQSSSSSSQQTVQGKGTTGIIWSKSATCMLIDLYKQYENVVSTGKMKKKYLWETISLELNKVGYTVNPDQVSERWKSLLRAYKNTKDHNKKSGSNLKTYEYEDKLDDIFSTNPTINPVYTLTSSQSAGTFTESETDEESKGKSESACSSSSSEKIKKRKSSGANDIAQVFKQFIVDQKTEWERRDKRDRERMEVMKSLVDALKSKSDENKE